MNSYPRPTANKPTLLDMDQVMSLLHETCHGLHNLACKAKYAVLHGTAVSRDFVEIPPMVIENLCTVPRFVQEISCHYSHISDEYARNWRHARMRMDGDSTQECAQIPLPPQQIPVEMITAIIQRRNTSKKTQNLSTLHHSLFDMAVHDPSNHADIENMDLAEVWNKLKKKATLLDGPEVLGEGWRWGAGHTRLRNMTIGYDAGYYTYLRYVMGR
jgi:metallopeptidase MepB